MFKCCFKILWILCIFSVNIAYAQVVEIPDLNLERAIRENLQLPAEAPITQSVMSQLDVLNVGGQQIADLTGLEYATHINGLILVGNGITDITPLAELVTLGFLTIVENPIADLSPLTNLTQLKELYLVGFPINDLTPIQSLTQLQTLQLYACGITDIIPLANLTNLIELDLNDNQIADISPLANLTALKKLNISGNKIADFTPIQGLSLIELRYDQVCILPDPPILDRIQTRNLPSVPQVFDPIVNLPDLSYQDNIAYHDLFTHHLPFKLRFLQSSPWSQLAGDIDAAIAQREELLARNPNMIFLAEIRIMLADPNVHYPEDAPFWIRDENGELVTAYTPTSGNRLLDFTLPELQDVIVEQAIAVSKCGLYDGIFFDAWSDVGRLLVTFKDGEPWRFYKTFEEEIEARLSIVQRIRANVPDDFLILCNANWSKLPITGSYINGSFMETFRDGYDVYQDKTVAEIEDSLLWLEENVREPQINIVRGEGMTIEPPDSPTNLRFMRLFTTMSLTLSDGYALYTTGHDYQNHFWYPFWNANLGQPVSPPAQLYQGIPSLYIREFTNGWAVYNRSGKPQTINPPQFTVGVSSKRGGIAHQLSDLDGEIYLKAKNPADINNDGVVNILDLVLVANGFGTSSPDVNGDSVANVLDLVIVASYFE